MGFDRGGSRIATRSSLRLSNDEIQSELLSRSDRSVYSDEVRRKMIEKSPPSDEREVEDEANAHILSSAATDVSFLMADTSAGSSCFISCF